MRGRKSQKRKVWKGILTVCMIVLLAAGTAFSLQEKVQAMDAPAASCINVLALYDQNGELITVTPAVGVQDSAPFVISAYAENVSFSYVRFITDNAEYDLEYRSGNESLNFSMWSIVGNVGQDSAFLTPAYAYEGENVAAVFYSRVNGEAKVLYHEMVLTGWKENLLIADSYPSGDILYPASIVDQNGQLVGVYLREGIALDPLGNEETFYGSGGSDNPGGSGGSGGSDNPGSSGGSSGSRDTAPALRGIFSSDDDDDEEEEKEGNEEGSGLLAPILIGSLIVVVVAAVVLVVVLVGRKNKKSAAAPAGSSPDFGMSPQGGTGQFWLAARGGRMDGRVYPVDNREITIGRDISSTISYPADTPGVSRVHAKLYREGARLMLMDCSSSAGTFLNRIGRLEPMRPVEVYAGDVFYVGEASNSFEIKG